MKFSLKTQAIVLQHVSWFSFTVLSREKSTLIRIKRKKTWIIIQTRCINYNEYCWLSVGNRILSSRIIHKIEFERRRWIRCRNYKCVSSIVVWNRFNDNKCRWISNEISFVFTEIYRKSPWWGIYDSRFELWQLPARIAVVYTNCCSLWFNTHHAFQELYFSRKRKCFWLWSLV